jgi:hypothetical protein
MKLTKSKLKQLIKEETAKLLKEQKMTLDNSVPKFNMYNKAHGGKGKFTVQFFADKISSGKLDPKKYFNFIRNKVEPWLQKQKKPAARTEKKPPAQSKIKSKIKFSEAWRNFSEDDKNKYTKIQMELFVNSRKKNPGAPASMAKKAVNDALTTAVMYGWVPSMGTDGIASKCARCISKLKQYKAL